MITHFEASFIIKLIHLKDIWLFNCCDGCQHIIIQEKIKVNQISKIIIADLHIDNLSGLLGLLSSLNLSGRNKPLHIYGPLGLEEYLDLGKKYSHTNFCYNIYIHTIQKGLFIDHIDYRIYALLQDDYFEFIIISHEKYGKFSLGKAKKFRVISGPLYGQLKKSVNFILPDGFILNGVNFTNCKYLGTKLVLCIYRYHNRQFIQNSVNSQILLYKI
uniref:Ribonuclease Z n=1 Tax=Antithamnion hubbsii TaxID=1005974 RepID=A0A4D6WS93_9FLOR|nr:ribonuclease Z [Antithamnion hubbsii]